MLEGVFSYECCTNSSTMLLLMDSQRSIDTVYAMETRPVVGTVQFCRYYRLTIVDTTAV